MLVDGVRSSASNPGAELGLPPALPPVTTPEVPLPTSPSVTATEVEQVEATEQVDDPAASLNIGDPYAEDQRVRFRLATDAGTAIFLFLGFVFLGMTAGWTMAQLRAAGSHRRH